MVVMEIPKRPKVNAAETAMARPAGETVAGELLGQKAEVALSQAYAEGRREEARKEIAVTEKRMSSLLQGSAFKAAAGGVAAGAAMLYAEGAIFLATHAVEVINFAERAFLATTHISPFDALEVALGLPFISGLAAAGFAYASYMLFKGAANGLSERAALSGRLEKLSEQAGGR